MASSASPTWTKAAPIAAAVAAAAVLLPLALIRLSAPAQSQEQVPSEASSALPKCDYSTLPFVREIPGIPASDYGISGLSHITVSGHVHHGNQKIDVWLETISPGSGTPIHRHDNEEVFLVLKGRGRMTVVEEASGKAASRVPVSHEFGPNTTFTVRAGQIHQLINPETNTEDLHAYFVLSDPPVKTYIYPTFEHPHEETINVFPIFWDRSCQEPKSQESQEL